MNGTGTAEDPYVITNAEELQAISEDINAYYALGNDIDATETSNWNAGAGFEPIGLSHGSIERGPAFKGVFNGRGYTIEGLTIRRPKWSGMAMFAESEGLVKNVHISRAKIEGHDPAVLVSQNSEKGVIESASATGSVTTDDSLAGGLVGINGGKINESWADVDVSGAEYYTGGLVGRSWYNGQISNSYAIGDVVGENRAGGIIGGNANSMQRVYATGRVDGSTTGGLAEKNNGLIVDSYWNIEATGQRNGVGEGGEAGTGLSTEEMTGTDVYSSMDALVSDEAWTATDGYPILQREVEGVSLSTDNEIVIAGNETDANVSLSLIGDRTETATTVAEYASNNPEIATISNGVVTGHQPGEVELSSTLAGNTGMTDVTVIANEGISAIDAEVDATDVTAGDTVTITATFRNVDENATYLHSDLLVNGEAVVTENVTVVGNADSKHTFEWTAESAGTYDLAIDGIDAGSVDVSPKSTTEQPADDNTGENADGSGDGEAGDNAPSGQSSSNGDDSGGLPVVPLALGGVAVAAGGGIVLGRRL